VVVRDAEGKVIVAASAGMDDSTVQALNGWGEGVVAAERGGGCGIRRGNGGLGVRVGGKSFAVVLGKGPAAIGYSGAIVTPLWTMGGRMLGALAVGADGLMGAAKCAGEGVGSDGGAGVQGGTGDGECGAGREVAARGEAGGIGIGSWRNGAC